MAVIDGSTVAHPWEAQPGAWEQAARTWEDPLDGWHPLVVWVSLDALVDAAVSTQEGTAVLDLILDLLAVPERRSQVIFQAPSARRFLMRSRL